jgi:hypothetical protein
VHQTAPLSWIARKAGITFILSSEHGAGRSDQRDYNFTGIIQMLVFGPLHHWTFAVRSGQELEAMDSNVNYVKDVMRKYNQDEFKKSLAGKLFYAMKIAGVIPKFEWRTPDEIKRAILGGAKPQGALAFAWSGPRFESFETLEHPFTTTVTLTLTWTEEDVKKWTEDDIGVVLKAKADFIERALRQADREDEMMQEDY